MISNRLSDISSEKEHFDKAAPIFNEALKNSGFNETLFGSAHHLAVMLKQMQENYFSPSSSFKWRVTVSGELTFLES